MAVNKVVEKVKPFAFTGTGAAVGAVAGGPVGLAVGAGAGALIDWWRKRRAAEIPQTPVLHMLPLQMQQQPYAPATLAAIHLRKIQMKPPSSKTPSPAEIAALKACRAKVVAARKAAGAAGAYVPAKTIAECQAQLEVYNSIAQAKTLLAKATSGGSDTGVLDLSASASFTIGQ